MALGAVLLARLIRWAAGRLIGRADRDERAGGEEALVVSEASKHRSAVVQGVSWGLVALVYFVAALLFLDRLNVPVATLVAPATLVGAAVGFGSQRIVQDLLSGFFLLSERQYGYGDIISIAAPGSTTGISGTVEELTLRTTKLRTLGGELVVIPNGEVRQVTNRSKDWARIVVDLPLALDADVPEATEILHRIGDEIWDDPEWRPLLLDPPTTMGIEKFGLGFLQLRFVARTLPGKQWDVGRELRWRIARAFREAGIAVPQSAIVSDPAEQ